MAKCEGITFGGWKQVQSKFVLNQMTSKLYAEKNITV
jgi:hypothetical protein